MTANLRIETDRREDALKIANAALRWRPPGTGTDQPAGSTSPNAAPGARALTEFVGALKADLQLNPDQTRQVDDIVADATRQFAGLRGGEIDADQRRQQAGQIRRQLGVSIRAILEPAQQERFDTIVARMAAAREGRGTSVPGRLFIVGPDNRPVAVQVRLGVSDGTMTEIVGGDLTAGQQVIVGGGPRPPATPPTVTPTRFGF
jgi:HlyD family secretion protein